MPKIRILHFSDIHWHPKHEEEVQTVTNAMIADLKSLEQAGPLNFDFAIFTGDLVLAGEVSEHFQSAWEKAIIPVLNAAKIPQDKIFICPGNHDVERKKVRDNKYLEDGLALNLTSVESVNEFIKRLDQSDKSSVDALERMQNYSTFASKVMPKPYKEDGNVVVYHVDLLGVKVGIACFDNSWRSTGERGGVDRHNLLMGERNVDHAIEYVEDSDLSIALFHHPITWLADFDATAVAARLYRGFDLLAFGHVHAAEPEVRTTIAGSSVMSQSGALFAGRKHYNGYQILGIDTDICKVEVLLRTYFDKPMARFGAAENILPLGKGEFYFQPSRGDANPSLELFLREVRPTIRKSASVQFNIADLASDLVSDPHGAFICPPLYLKKTKSRPSETTVVDAEVTGVETPVREVVDRKTADDETFLEEDGPADLEEEGPAEEKLELANFLMGSDSAVFVGGREAGKTSLAHFIATLVSEGTCDRVRVPLIVDHRKFHPNLYQLQKAAANYLGISKTGFDLEKSLEAGELFIIIDNYSGLDAKVKKSYEAFFEKYQKNRWILLADSRFGSTNQSVSDNDLIEGFEVASIRELPRKSIRELSRRWSEKSDLDNEKAFSMVMLQIETNNLPRTGYIVTLLLWAMKHSKKDERLNEAVLLMNMADYLLGKADFRKSLEGDFDATSKEITLQAFANHMRVHGDFIHPNAAIQFFIEFFSNKGLNYDASKVLDTLCECGILFRDAETVGFKYRCFQEYFLAKYIGSAEARLKETVFQRNYLRYMRELEILAGLSRENDIIIKELSWELDHSGPSEISDTDLSTFDDVVDEESSIGMSQRKLRKIREKKMTTEQIDDLMDSAEAQMSKKRTQNKGSRAAQQQENDREGSNDEPPSSSVNGTGIEERLLPKLSFLNYMQTVELLGRVLRNSEFTDMPQKISGVRLYLKSNARLFLTINRLVGEAFARFADDVDADDEAFDEESRRALNYILTKRLMLMVSGRIREEMASSKLTNVFDNILGLSDLTFAEKTFLTALQLNCGRSSWDESWINLAKNSKNRRLAVEFLTDTLWYHIHTKALSSTEQVVVENVAWEMERALGRDKRLKGNVLQNLRTATSKAIKATNDE